MATNIDTSKAVSKITYNGAEVPMDPAGKMDEFRMAFWTSLRDDPYTASGKFAFYNEDMIKAVLPVPPDEFFREGENGIPPFCPDSADYMFYRCDYPGAYRDSGLPSFDSSIYISSAEYMFASSTFTEIPFISLEYCRSNCTFSNAKCRVIKGFYVNEGTHLGTQAFYYCTELESIDFVDDAICESWNLKWSTKLTADTLSRIVNALCVVAEYNDSWYAEDYGLLKNPTLTVAKVCQEKMESTLLNGSTLPAVATQRGWTVVYA